MTNDSDFEIIEPGILKYLNRLLAPSAVRLRGKTIMPKLVNVDYSTEPEMINKVIQIPLPPVVRHKGDDSDKALYFGIAQLPLDNFIRESFEIREFKLVESIHRIDGLAEDTLDKLSSRIDGTILNLYKKFYGYFQPIDENGRHSPPFAGGDINDAIKINTILDEQLCPKHERNVVIDPEAEATALTTMEEFRDYSFSAAGYPTEYNSDLRVCGMDWFMSQNVPIHHSGKVNLNEDLYLSSNYKKGNKRVELRVSTSDKISDIEDRNLVVGDIIKFDDCKYTYTVIELDGNSVEIYPPLKKEYGKGTLVDVMPSHVANIAFHRDAIAFASRPLSGVIDDLDISRNNCSRTICDPISGICLTLSISRYKNRETNETMIRGEYSVLFGADVIRPELGMRIGAKAP